MVINKWVKMAGLVAAVASSFVGGKLHERAKHAEDGVSYSCYRTSTMNRGRGDGSVRIGNNLFNIYPEMLNSLIGKDVIGGQEVDNSLVETLDQYQHWFPKAPEGWGMEGRIYSNTEIASTLHRYTMNSHLENGKRVVGDRIEGASVKFIRE